MTTRTKCPCSQPRCPRSRWLHWHSVIVVVVSVLRDFLHFFWSKNSTWSTVSKDTRIIRKNSCTWDECAPYKQAKMVLQNFLCVRVVNHYADTMLAKSLTMRSWCLCSQLLRGHRQDYPNTFGKLWRLLTDFKGAIWWKKVLACVYKPNSNNLKIWKCPYLKKILRVRIVVDYADTRLLYFEIEYLCEKEKVCKTVFACSYGAQVKSLKQKNLVTLSL